MVKYDNEGKIIVGYLDDKNVLSKERIKREDYKQYKKDFEDVVELLSTNLLYHSTFEAQLKYEIGEKLEFKTFVDPYLETFTQVVKPDYLSKEDNQIYIMDVLAYEQFVELCFELLIKVSRSWNKLNEVEKFILKCLEFDNPPDTDENIAFELRYDPKKYYQYKESGFIKIGMQLRVNEARKNSFNKYPEALDKTSIGE